MVALKSLRPSSAGGVDGLRSGHLMDLKAPPTADAGRPSFVQTSYEAKYLNTLAKILQQI